MDLWRSVDPHISELSRPWRDSEKSFLGFGPRIGFGKGGQTILGYFQAPLRGLGCAEADPYNVELRRAARVDPTMALRVE